MGQNVECLSAETEDKASSDIVLETGRLRLRQPKMSDAPHIARYAGDYDISSMTSSVPHPYPEMAVEMWIMIRNIARQSSDNNHMVMEIKTKAGFEVCGMAGIFKRDPTSDWEIGYWIAKPFWRKGLATEAGQGLIDFARQKLGANRIIAGHFEDNPASGRVLEKLGFVYTGESCNTFSMARMGKANCLDMELELEAV